MLAQFFYHLSTCDVTHVIKFTTLSLLLRIISNEKLASGNKASGAHGGYMGNQPGYSSQQKNLATLNGSQTHDHQLSGLMFYQLSRQAVQQVGFTSFTWMSQPWYREKNNLTRITLLVYHDDIIMAYGVIMMTSLWCSDSITKRSNALLPLVGHYHHTCKKSRQTDATTLLMLSCITHHCTKCTSQETNR